MFLRLQNEGQIKDTNSHVHLFENNIGMTAVEPIWEISGI